MPPQITDPREEERGLIPLNFLCKVRGTAGVSEPRVSCVV